VKGLYAKAAAGGVAHFTGKDSSFEAPSADDSDWMVATDTQSEAESVEGLLTQILPIITSTQG
jgi:adenylylsulfate kinase